MPKQSKIQKETRKAKGTNHEVKKGKIKDMAVVGKQDGSEIGKKRREVLNIDERLEGC